MNTLQLHVYDSGHETVCGQTVSELIDLLGLPDFLDGIVATARGYICDALGSEAQPGALQGEGYFDTLMEIIQKLLQLGLSKCSVLLEFVCDLINCSLYLNSSYYCLEIPMEKQMFQFQVKRQSVPRQFLSLSTSWDFQMDLKTW